MDEQWSWYKNLDRNFCHWFSMALRYLIEYPFRTFTQAYLIVDTGGGIAAILGSLANRFVICSS